MFFEAKNIITENTVDVNNLLISIILKIINLRENDLFCQNHLF